MPDGIYRVHQVGIVLFVINFYYMFTVCWKNVSFSYVADTASDVQVFFDVYLTLS